MEGMTGPQYYWDPVIAPGGMLFYRGDAFAKWTNDVLIASLVPGALVRLEMNGDRVAAKERLLPDQGRIRDLAETSDGAVLALVDAEDGAILRLTPKTD